MARRPNARRLAGLLRRVAPTWLAQIPWLVGADEKEEFRQSLQAVRPERMQREFATFIEALTTDVPLQTAVRTTDQSERDQAIFKKAVRSGRVDVVMEQE